MSTATAVVPESHPELPMWLVPITDIKVGERFRKDVGDLASLAASIDKVGLLNPPVVTRDNRLVTGLRRLRAAEHLGWELIEVRVLDLDEVLQAEYDENEVRKNFTVTERASIALALQEREKEAAAERKKAGRKQASSKMEEGKKANEAMTRAAKAAGMSATTLEKVLAIQKATDDDPSLQWLVDEMNRTGKVDPYYKHVFREDRPKKSLTPSQQLVVLEKRTARLEEVDPTEFAQAVVQAHVRDEAMKWVTQVESWLEAFTDALEEA